MVSQAKQNTESSDELLERLRFIEIYTRKRILAHLLGEYESSLKGTGFEFLEHKRYQRGDDYRRIDWNVTARLQYPFVKQFLAEKEVNVWLISDLSSSMYFGSAQLSKAQVMKEIVAVLGFSASYLNMKVGFSGFSDEVEMLVKPRHSRGVTWEILRLIPSSRSSRRPTEFGGIVQELEKRIEGTSMIFFLSDFIAQKQFFEIPQVKHLARNHDLIPVVIEDPLERVIPQVSGLHYIEDPESGQRRTFYWSRENVQEYLRKMKRRREDLMSAFYGMNLDFLWIDTGDEHFVDRLVEFFVRRRRL